MVKAKKVKAKKVKKTGQLPLLNYEEKILLYAYPPN